MHKFTLIWFGQLISTIGSYMSDFALSLWAWELTGTATALALVGFFYKLPRILVSLFAGIVVDRANRKYLMMLGDAIAATSALIILILYLSGSLMIWHLYLAASLKGGFGQIQGLAYSTSIALLVSAENYTRANSMSSAVHYGSNIIAPALAGTLYPIIGLGGILPIDLTTFAVAIATLAWVTIPSVQRENPSQAVEKPNQFPDKLRAAWQELTFGMRHIWQHHSLRSLLLITAVFWFFHDLGGTLHSPMILARSQNNAQVLGAIASAAGISGVTGAIILSVWGGPKRRVNGMLAGFIGAGLSKTVFGLGRSPVVWIPAQFCSSLNFPLLGSCEIALWMTQITPEKQGRVFAANALVLQLVSAIAVLLAGPLADQLLEPAMMSAGRLVNLLSFSFGSGPGAGMAVLYTACALAMLLIGVGGFFVQTLRTIETSSNIENYS
ncbi:MAG: MFS transporter [Cyanobacteria bacterium P01_D01_bin.71]